MEFTFINNTGKIYLQSVADSIKSNKCPAGILKSEIAKYLNVDEEEFYLTKNGKLLDEVENVALPGDYIDVIPRVLGGKGGFGSMLRAIGAQIEKTTNRDACRDLSGRRLRDINEEQRLKRWFAKQKEREEEKAEAKKRKLEKLKKITEGPPLPAIDDQQYNKQRAEMADSVYAAVDKGFESLVPETGLHSVPKPTSTITKPSDDSSSDCSTPSESTDTPEPSTSSNTVVLAEPSSSKPTLSDKEFYMPKKVSGFKKTMLDEDLDSCSSSEEEDEVPPKKSKVVQ